MQRLRDSLERNDFAPGELEQAATRFTRLQPWLTAHLRSRLHGTASDDVLALGQLLCLIVFLAFEAAHGDAVPVASPALITDTLTLMAADHGLREQRADELCDSDEAVAREQPALVPLLDDYVAATLEQAEEPLDIDALDEVYRLALLCVLVLSYALDEGRQGARLLS